MTETAQSLHSALVAIKAKLDERSEDGEAHLFLNIPYWELDGLLAAHPTDTVTVTGQTSDGYHTFDELYRFRMLYNAALFNAWSAIAEETCSNYLPVHKSLRHHDGEECFGGGWFIVMAYLPTGQISNHYEIADWDLFQVPEQERADEWDGHTAADVAQRLESFLRPQESQR